MNTELQITLISFCIGVTFYSFFAFLNRYYHLESVVSPAGEEAPMLASIFIWGLFWFIAMAVLAWYPAIFTLNWVYRIFKQKHYINFSQHVVSSYRAFKREPQPHS